MFPFITDMFPMHSRFAGGSVSNSTSALSFSTDFPSWFVTAAFSIRLKRMKKVLSLSGINF
jgi:hypothetical protein